MLLANEAVAAYLEDEEVPVLYRVHEPPDPMKVAEFEAFVSPLGYGLDAESDAVRPAHFQRVVERMRGRPEERPIALVMLRTMQKARYDPAALGHFGLATASYTHFTSPIRRYPDLVVHRALRAVRLGLWSDEQSAERDEAMPDLARQLSFLERRADEAERELVQWKKTRFMAKRVGEIFEGYITGVAAFGVFVELVTHFVEGLVHISSMADDYYRFDDRTQSLRGESTGKAYRLGDRVTVQVIRVDLERRRVELGILDMLEAVKLPTRGRTRRRSAASPATAKRQQRPGKRERLARKSPGRPRR